MSSEKVLVVDDEEHILELARLYLSREGYLVDSVEAGDDAIEQLRFYEYDVAVIDWRMPRASGLQVVEWARRHERATAGVFPSWSATRRITAATERFASVSVCGRPRSASAIAASSVPPQVRKSFAVNSSPM